MSKEENKTRGLGMGIATLLGGHNNPYISVGENGSNINKNLQVLELDINAIHPNPNQPRKTFDESKLQELSESIALHGLLQPILITKDDDKYIIVAGERRYRAAKIAGLQTIKAILLDLNEKEILRNAIIENIQREDLNPVEEAVAYKNMIDTFGYTHEVLSNEVGKSRSHITNLLRILSLPDRILISLKNGNISLGHAKVLLSCDDPDHFLDLVIDKNLSVRNLEKEIENYKNKDELFEEKSQKKPLSTPGNITYEMIKKLYQPFIDSSSSEEEINQNELSQLEYKPSGFDDNVINLPVNNDDEMKTELVNNEELKKNIKTIEQHICEHTNLDIKLNMDPETMRGNIQIAYKDSEELLEIVNKLFFDN
jgi:ParB family chromosome partitioning protein